MVCAVQTLFAAIVAINKRGKDVPLFFQQLANCLQLMVEEHESPSYAVREALHRSLAIASNQREANLHVDLPEMWRTVASHIASTTLRAMVSMITGVLTYLCGDGHVEQVPDDQCYNTGLEVIATSERYKRMIATLTKAHELDRICHECGSREACTRVATFVVLGGMLAIMVKFPVAIMVLDIPRTFNFSGQEWFAKAVCRHLPDHWVADVASQTGQLWTANDALASMCGEARFPAGRGALIFAEAQRVDNTSVNVMDEIVAGATM